LNRLGHPAGEGLQNDSRGAVMVDNVVGWVTVVFVVLFFSSALISGIWKVYSDSQVRKETLIFLLVMTVLGLCLVACFGTLAHFGIVEVDGSDDWDPPEQQYP
jgi:hypothetical protein